VSPVRVWLNRNFATSLFLMRQLRDNPDGTPVEIFASHTDPASPVLTGADHVIAEPDGTAEDFVDRVLATCRRYRIDVFLPVAGQPAIAARLAEFTAAGVAVICPPADAVTLLADKAATYRDLAADPELSELVPPWCAVSGLDDFDAALTMLDPLWTDSRPLVLKPAAGVGAEGVRFLHRDGPGLADLLGPVGVGLPVEFARRALAGARAVPDLLLMPYLPGPEISLDLLADRGELVTAVPRSKIGRRRVLAGDPRLIGPAAALVRRYRLHGLVNAQFRWFDDRPVLLEINTRPAGGLHQTELAGVNLVWGAVRIALGLPADVPVPVLGAEYATVTSIVPLDGPADQRISARTRSMTPLTNDSTAASA
jgi:biotin carboxylase